MVFFEKWRKLWVRSRSNGGETGIRTLGGVTPTTVFETAPFDHSGISPWGCFINLVLQSPLQILKRFYGVSYFLKRFWFTGVLKWDQRL